MKPSEFDRAVERTRLQERAQRMARAVLVEGVGATEAARREGLTPQAADQAAKAVGRAWRKLGGHPDGWRVVTVCLPPALAREIQSLPARIDDAKAEALVDYLLHLD